MKRLSEYVKDVEDFVAEVFTTKLVPPVKVVVILEDGVYAGCYANDPFVEVSIHHLDENDDEAEIFFREKQLKEDTLPCPYPIDVTQMGGPVED